MATYIAKNIKVSTCCKDKPSLTTWSTNGVCHVQGSNSSYIYRAFLQYDLSGLPENAAILSATMYVNCHYWNDSTKNGTTNIARVTSEWSEDTCCWNNMPTWEGTYLEKNVSPPEVGAWAKWDITDLVNEWVDGTHPNYGLHVVNNNEGDYRVNWQFYNHYWDVKNGDDGDDTNNLATYIEIEYVEEEYYKVKKSTMTAIANGARTLAGIEEKMTPSEIAKALKGVSSVLEWKTYETKLVTASKQNYDLSALSDAHDFLFVIPVIEDNTQNLTILVDKDTLNSDTEMYFRSGYYFTNSNYCLAQVRMKNMVASVMVYINGTAVETCQATLKYR